MDRIFNSNSQKEKIYAIYKACRLCGAGGGFKMPIIQNVVDLDENGVQLRQKIWDCVQIEVKLNDRMPPLICELCIEKINDFFEFLELCQQTNKRTRMQLGLPLKQAQGASESDDCILGNTEPVFLKDEDDDQPLSKQKRNVKVPVEKKVCKEAERRGVKEAEKKGGKEAEKKGGNEAQKKGGKEAIRTGCKPENKINKEVEALKATQPVDDFKSNAQRISRGSKRSLSPSLSPARTTRLTSKSNAPRSSQSIKRSASPTSSPTRASPSTSKSNAPRSSRSSKWSASRSPSPIRTSRSTNKHNAPRTSRGSKQLASPSPSPARTSQSTSKSLRYSWGSKRSVSRSPTTARASRCKTGEKQDKPTKIPTPILKKDKEVKKKEALPAPSRKRVREAELPKLEVLTKKVKIQPAPPKPVKPSLKSKDKPKSPPVSSPVQCKVCSLTLKHHQALNPHLRSHVVTYTDPKLACNACGTWFKTHEEAASHHKKHKKHYECQRCYQAYPTCWTFDVHLKSSCISDIVVPDVQCVDCWRFFVTDTVRSQHKCLGLASRPVKCKYCDRQYQTKKTLRRHESTCSVKKKDVKVDPEIMSRLMPLQIRVARCDPLLRHNVNGHFDVSTVRDKYGLDRNCVYPYTPVRIKSEFCINANDEMVNISDDFQHKFYSENHFIHWDETSSDDDNTTISKRKIVDNLSTLSLKTLFSNKCLGKVPKKRRKVKPESVFDLMFNDRNVTRDINNITSNLDNVNEDSNDSLFGNKGNDRTDFNADFDSLLNNDEASNNSEEQSILKDFVSYSNIDEEDKDEITEDTEIGDDTLTAVSEEIPNDTMEHQNASKDTCSKEIEPVMESTDRNEYGNTYTDIKSDNTSLGENESEPNDSAFANLDTKSDSTSMGDNNSQLNEPESENTETKSGSKFIGKTESKLNESESAYADTKTDNTPMDVNQSEQESKSVYMDTEFDCTPISCRQGEGAKISTKLDCTVNEGKLNDSECANTHNKIDTSKSENTGEQSQSTSAKYVDISDTVTPFSENDNTQNENLHHHNICNTGMESKSTDEDANSDVYDDRKDMNKSKENANSISDGMIDNEIKVSIKENSVSESFNSLDSQQVENNEVSLFRSESTKLRKEPTEMQNTNQQNNEEQKFHFEISADNYREMSNENSIEHNSNKSDDRFKDCVSNLDISDIKTNTVGNDNEIELIKDHKDDYTEAQNVQENKNNELDIRDDLNESNLEANRDILMSKEKEVNKKTEENLTNNTNENSNSRDFPNGSEKSSYIEEIDDDKLMDAINMQIGEDRENNLKNSSGDKMTLEDLIQDDKPCDKSMELDNISDEEFNFDS